MDNEPENAHFTEALAAVRNVWDENRLNACIEEAIELLEPMHLPGYHRMSKVLLLASCVGDRNLADLYCQEGEILWEIMRLWKPKGGTAIDAAMDRLYTIITVLKREIKAEQVEFSAKARADADAEGARNLKKEEGEDERNSEVKEEQPAGAQNYRVEVQAEEARHNSLRRVDSCHDDNNSQSGPDPVKSLSYTRSRAPGGIDAMTQDSYRKQTENAVQDPGDDGTAPATQDIDGLSVTRDSQAIKRDELEKLEAELAAASARRSPINASHTPNTQEAAPRHGFLPIWPAAPKTQTKAIDDSKFKLHKDIGSGQPAAERSGESRRRKRQRIDDEEQRASIDHKVAVGTEADAAVVDGHVSKKRTGFRDILSRAMAAVGMRKYIRED